jgi:hypothetical protein
MILDTLAMAKKFFRKVFDRKPSKAQGWKMKTAFLTGRFFGVIFLLYVIFLVFFWGYWILIYPAREVLGW